MNLLEINISNQFWVRLTLRSSGIYTTQGKNTVPLIYIRVFLSKS